jgi:hypothetical protein
VHPSFVPPGGSFATDNGGTEYFVSSLDPNNTLDNRLAVWAMTNTSSLNASPSLTFTNSIVNTETYGAPPGTDQKAGPTPLLNCIFSGGRGCPVAAQRIKNHEELIEDNDDRQQQVTYAQGMLWTSVPSIVKTPQGPVRAGAAWFILSPSVSGNQVSATVANQGYVAINSAQQDSVLFPAVGVNAFGQGAISFSIAGRDYYPSAGYVTLDVTHGTGPIVISFPGVAPDDGFTAYRPLGPDFRGGRWGDYSWATADESGNIWMGSEVIPEKNPLETFVPFANWGTFITAVTP